MDKHTGITIWARDERTETEIGINGDGDLFLGNNCGGYNLPDTPENREYIKEDFRRYTDPEYPVDAEDAEPDIDLHHPGRYAKPWGDNDPLVAETESYWASGFVKSDRS